MKELRTLIREVPDFPKKGILFRDITTLLKNPAGLEQAVEGLVAPWRGKGVTQVVCLESRGFLLGSPVALALGAGLVPARKPGKLPAETVQAEYALEYGTDRLEMHRDAIRAGDRVLVVDDLLATGGTVLGTIELVKTLKVDVVLGCAFLVELRALGGRARIAPLPATSLIVYD
jgi:adenine phosphoribosyltransferase